MRSQNKPPTAILLVLLTAIIFLSACKPPDKSQQSKDNTAPATAQTPQIDQDTPKPTAVPSPTIVYQDGSAKITIFRVLSTTTANSGNIIHYVEGTVPVLIKFNKEKNIWEMKGSNLGIGTTEFTDPECNCQVAWSVEFTISGVMVPTGGLTSNPDDGCYVEFYSNEDWEQTDAACNCTFGSAVGGQSPEQIHFGPMKLYLADNKQTGEINTIGNTSWDYRWVLKDLLFPLEFNCLLPYDQ